jgi:hypothetical protein
VSFNRAVAVKVVVNNNDVLVFSWKCRVIMERGIKDYL